MGFNDPFYFSKAFKKRTGTTPKKYAGNPKNGRGGVSYMPINRKKNRKKNRTNNNRSDGKTRVEKRAFYFAEKVV